MKSIIHPMPLLFRTATVALFLGALLLSQGCVAGKVIVTPLTLVRDVVDVPLVSVTNVFEYFAEQTRLAKAPNAGVGWSWKGGFNFGIGYDISWLLFKSVSGIFGAVDYIICRSIWPNFPNGISPWRREGQTWGSLYFPNTRVLWGDDRPIYRPAPKPPE